jgi:hypothetical protein
MGCGSSKPETTNYPPAQPGTAAYDQQVIAQHEKEKKQKKKKKAGAIGGATSILAV